MKHNLKISIIVLAMFILAQLIGLYIVNFYILNNNSLPYGFDKNEGLDKTPDYYIQLFLSLITSFIIAIILVSFLMKIRSARFMRFWFFFVVTVALGITINVLFVKLGLAYASILALVLGLILAYFKVFKRNIIIHNLTELFIYPGIAPIFIALLNLPAAIIMLILISIYDLWAVWKSKIMIKMTKYQINEVGIFSGLLIPYASSKIKAKLKNLKLKYHNKIPQRVLKKSKIRVNLAILGGGDIVFSLIAAGVFYKTTQNIYSTLIVVLFAALALSYLLIFGYKKKSYPAMPYLTTGILIGMAIARLLIH